MVTNKYEVCISNYHRWMDRCMNHHKI